MFAQPITDKARIEEVLRDCMLNPKKRSPEFIPEIRVAAGAQWGTRTVGLGGLIIEGARPMGLVTHCDTGEKVFSLTNSDSGYTRLIGQVKLSEIVSISLLQ